MVETYLPKSDWDTEKKEDRTRDYNPHQEDIPSLPAVFHKTLPLTDNQTKSPVCGPPRDTSSKLQQEPMFSTKFNFDIHSFPHPLFLVL